MITLITCKHWSSGLISNDSPQYHPPERLASPPPTVTFTLSFFHPHSLLFPPTLFLLLFCWFIPIYLSFLNSVPPGGFFDSSVLSLLSFVPSPLGLISCFVLWIGLFRFHFPPLHSFSCSTSPLISMKIRMEGVRKEEVGGWRPGGKMMKMTFLCNLGLWVLICNHHMKKEKSKRASDWSMTELLTVKHFFQRETSMLLPQLWDCRLPGNTCFIGVASKSARQGATRRLL